MLWNRFEEDRAHLDLFAHPHFEPATGIIEEQDAIAAIARIDGPSHAIIKAKASAFFLEHCAIDVNPKCWFGVNFAGRIPKYAFSPFNSSLSDENSPGKALLPRAAEVHYFMAS